MALLVSPCPCALSVSSNPSPRLRRFSAVSSMAKAIDSESETQKGRAAVLWFKHDLRVDDHPGLVTAAARHRTVVPLYIFDRRILSRFSDEMLELVIFSVEGLRKSLINQGSNLMIKFGSSENILLEIVNEIKATSVYIEEEVESDLRKVVDVVKETLATMTFLDGKPEIILWQTPLYYIKNLRDLPALYADFKALAPLISPVPPAMLPCAEIKLEWGSIPTFDDLKAFIKESKSSTKKSWTIINGDSGHAILCRDHVSQIKPNSFVETLESSWSANRCQDNSIYSNQREKALVNSRSAMQKEDGETAALNALLLNLRYLQESAHDDWLDVLQSFLSFESQRGASFGSLFCSALCLGVISRRRMHFEILKNEKKRYSRRSQPFMFSAPSVAAAADMVSSLEWYWLLALKSQINDEGKYPIQIWRWKGYLIQYTAVGDEGPSVLLVHGFGAFLDHFRDNMLELATGGYRVWAITLLGFGKSEKPNVVYTELLWAELLRDFIVEVVGEPVHLVGNSIGGYLVAIVAKLWHGVAKSIVLVNAAGNIIPGYSAVVFAKERRTSWLTWVGARFLQFFLRLRVKNLVQNCYPARTERADDWLVNEMLRASHDPGAVQVLASIFSFNLSIPLNYLLEGVEERVLVIQGMRDPLSNSKSKLALLRECCPGVAIREVDAGHCPHDEKPEEVNAILSKWLVSVEMKLPVTAPSC